MVWEIDRSHSLAEFSVQHLKIATVKGQFTEIHGTIETDTKNPERSWVKAQILTNSIYTGTPQRDVHLRTADFFEVSTYPTITFESSQVQHVDTNRFIIGGNLSLHGMTRFVQLRTLYTGANQDHLTNAWRIGLHAIAEIDRRDFNFTYKETNNVGIALVGNEIKINLIIEAVWIG
ncbi:MAG TPA: YceI family protein [Dictyobacter sp.]|jgi:polyisoprenoid-binding protein YceI|nr:YceI family protein [Dictyobacter sp.]